MSATNGLADLAFSGTGAMVYVPGGVTGAGSNLAWMDRKGTAQSLPAPLREHGNLRLTPDGQHVAVEIATGVQRDIWVYEPARNTLTRLTFEGANQSPVWTPDGRWLSYISDEAGTPQAYVRPFPGPGGKWQISTDGANRLLWARNGRELFCVRRGVMSARGQPSAGTWPLMATVSYRQAAGPAGAGHDRSVARGHGVVRGAEAPRAGGEEVGPALSGGFPRLRSGRRTRATRRPPPPSIPLSDTHKHAATPDPPARRAEPPRPGIPPGAS